MTGLKPCPFCGEAGVAVSSSPCGWHEPPVAWHVCCLTKGCHGAIFALGYDLFATPEEAIAAWNTRALPDRDMLAFTLWRNEAARAAPNVVKYRTLKAFLQDTLPAEQERWRGHADAALFLFDTLKAHD